MGAIVHNTDVLWLEARALGSQISLRILSEVLQGPTLGPTLRETRHESNGLNIG